MVKLGVFSALKGDSPFHSRPALFRRTLRPTTADTGRRTRISSRILDGERNGGLGCSLAESRGNAHSGRGTEAEHRSELPEMHAIHTDEGRRSQNAAAFETA